MYKAEQVAGYIVKKCVSDGQPISNLQLQKILYYVQLSFLKTSGALFEDDFEAWQFGPVVPAVYYKYSAYGSMPIDIFESKYHLDSDSMAIIDPIVDEKRELNPWDLVKETHRNDGAWDRIFQHGKGNRQVIPKQLIKTAG